MEYLNQLKAVASLTYRETICSLFTSWESKENDAYILYYV